MASSIKWYPIVILALYSRFVVIVLQFLANTAVPDHDAEAFKPPLTGEENFTVVDKAIFFLLGGFYRWDAIYFLHIAQHGYTYENCVAFFPLPPLLLHISSYAIPCASDAASLLLAGVLLNVAVFAATAVLLLFLGHAATQNCNITYCAAVLFCFNPASVFMTAPYSETCFACLSFAAILCVQQRKVFMGALLIGISSLTRSNGLVTLGFCLHYFAAEFIQKVRTIVNLSNSKLKVFIRIFLQSVSTVLQVLFCLILASAPFVCFQSYIYELFCFPEMQKQAQALLEPSLVAYGRSQGYKIVGDNPVSPWCFARLPLSYSYIQSQHWDVGFFTYYQLKQIPNFILAAPVITLSLSACCSFYKKHPVSCQFLGLVPVEKQKVETVGSQTIVKFECMEWTNPDLVVYVLHLLFLVTFGCCFMHIQVLTRFLCSASPFIYWFAADVVLRQFPDINILNDSPIDYLRFLDFYRSNHKSVLAKGVVLFFLGYTVIGTIAFANFLPWT